MLQVVYDGCMLPFETLRLTFFNIRGIHLIMQVILVNSDSCGSHGNCSACIGSGDPLCGWCVLEGVCSRSSVCAHYMLPGRWAVDYCPAHTFELQRYDVAISRHDCEQLVCHQTKHI